MIKINEQIMKVFSRLNSKKWFLFTGIGLIIVIAGFALTSFLPSSNSLTAEKKKEAETINPSLANQVEDLNNVLPQKLDLNTYFDSVGLGTNQLHYYYSIFNLTKKDFTERELRDSLYTEAVDRIPCTLWRPLYMQGVEVTFTYLSSDGEQLLDFARQQESCSQ